MPGEQSLAGVDGRRFADQPDRAVGPAAGGAAPPADATSTDGWTTANRQRTGHHQQGSGAASWNTLVREDIFAGFLQNDLARLARAEENLDILLANPWLELLAPGRFDHCSPSACSSVPLSWPKLTMASPTSISTRS
jgi:hypothetical protein